MRRHVLSLGMVFGALVACGGTGDNTLTDGGGNDGSMGNDGTQGNDGNPGTDGGGSDTGNDGASCPDFCSTIKGALFCSDFDMESMPTDWSKTVTSMGGTVDIEQTQFRSCPNGLHSFVPMVGMTSSGGPTAKVTKDVTSGGALGHVVLDIDVYLPSNDTKSYVAFFGVRPTSDANLGAYLTHHGDAFWFVSTAGFGSGNLNFAVTPGPLTGAWNHMTLDVHFGAQATASLVYTGDDNMPHTAMGTGTTASGNVVSGVTVEAGMVVSGFTGAEANFDSYYDNAVLKLGP